MCLLLCLMKSDHFESLHAKCKENKKSDDWDINLITLINCIIPL